MNKNTDDCVKTLRRLYNAGASGAELARKFQMPAQTVYTIISNRTHYDPNYTPRPGRNKNLKKIPKDVQRDIIERYLSGQSIKSITYRYGISHSAPKRLTERYYGKTGDRRFRKLVYKKIAQDSNSCET